MSRISYDDPSIQEKPATTQISAPNGYVQYDDESVRVHQPEVQTQSVRDVTVPLGGVQYDQDKSYSFGDELFTQRNVIRQQRRAILQRRNALLSKESSPADDTDIEDTVQSKIPIPVTMRSDEVGWLHAKTPYDPKGKDTLVERVFRDFYLDVNPAVISAASTIAQTVLGTKYGPEVTQRWQSSIERWKDAQLVHNYQPDPGDFGDINRVKPDGFNPYKLVSIAGSVANVMLASELGAVAFRGIGLEGISTKLAVRGLGPTIGTAVGKRLGGAVGASIATHFASELETEQKLNDLRYVTIDGKQQVVTVDQARQLRQQGSNQPAQLVYTPQQAKDYARNLALATFPISVAANLTFLPVVQAIGGKSFADSFVGAAIDGALNNTVGTLITGLPVKTGQYIFGAYQSAGQALNSAMYDAKMAFVTGGVLGGGLHLGQRLAFGKPLPQTFRETTGVDLDTYSPRHLFGQLLQEMKLEPREAQLATATWDKMVDQGVKIGLWNSVEDGWLKIHAGLAEQANQTFDDLSGVVLHQNASGSDAIFTKLRSQVLALDPKGKWTGQQMTSTLLNKGARADEFHWSGLREFLSKAQDEGKQVTRADMASFLDTRQLRINVIQKTDQAVPDAEFQQKFRAYEDADKAFSEAYANLNRAHPPEEDQILRQAKDKTEKNFREAENTYTTAKRRQSESQTQYGFVSPSGPRSNYEEWLFQLPVEFFAVKENARIGTAPVAGDKFRSSHFEEPNIIVHLRVDQRVDPSTGKKYLNLIEVQSDWHQKWREAGYIGSDKANQKGADPSTTDPNHVGVEPAPFAKSWTDLALSKFLSEAILRGYEHIAWQPGFMQDRFQGASEAGRAEFYNKIVMNKLVTLARKLDPNAKVGEVKIDTAESSGTRTEPTGRIADALIEKIPSIEITPKMRESLAGGKDLMGQVNESGLKSTDDPYFQGKQLRGLAQILKSGRGIIKGFASADKVTGLHELFHLARFFMLKGEDLQYMQTALSKLEHTSQELQEKGWSDGWTRKMEEGFVNRFLKYVEEGRAPRPDLIPFFKKFSRVLEGMEKSVSTISPEMRGVFDRLYEADTYPVATARERVETLASELEPAEASLKKAQELSTADSSDPAKKLAALQEEADIKSLREDYQRAEQELKNAQEAYRGTGSITRQEQLAKDWSIAQQLDIPADMHRRLLREGFFGKAATLWRGFFGFFESSKVLGKNETAYRTLGFLDRAWYLSRELMGKFHLAIWHHSYKALSSEHNAWLQETPNDPKLPANSGMSRLQRLMDETSLVPKGHELSADELAYAKSERPIFQWKNLAHWIQDRITNYAIETDVMRTLKSGDLVYPQKQYQDRFPRLATPEGLDFLSTSTPARDRLIAHMAEVNEKTVEFTEGEINRQVAQKERLQGMLELSRTLKYFPDTWEGIHIFNSQPTKSLNAMVFRTAARFAKIKTVGGGQIKNVYMDKETMYSVLEAAGVMKPKTLKVDLVDRAVTSLGYDKDYWSLLNKDQLLQVLKDQHIDVEENGDQVYQKLLALRSENFTTIAAEDKLRKLAKSLKGVDSEAPLAQVLYDVKDRISRDVDDNLTQRLKDSFHWKEGEGGDPALIERMFADLQGIPRKQVLDASRSGRAFEVFNTFWAGLQTSKAVIGQTVGTLSHAGVPGWLNSFKSLVTVLNDFKTPSERIAMLGIFQHTMPIWTGEASHLSTKFTKTARTAGGQLLGIDRGREWATLIGAQAGEFQAKTWIDKGFGWWGTLTGDKARARILGLNDTDIKLIEKGNLTERQKFEITQKVSLNSANKFIGGELAAPHSKSSVELDPVKGSILRFMRYAFETQRTSHALVDELVAGMKAGDVPRAFGAVMAATQFLTGAVGAGLTGTLIALSTNGQSLPEKEDEWIKAAKAGLLKAGVFGPIGSVLDNMSYHGNDSGSDLLVSSSAAFKPIADLLAAGFGKGPMGQFPWYKRFYEALRSNTPLYKAAQLNYENLVFPDHKRYVDVKRHYRDWISTEPTYWVKEGTEWVKKQGQEPDSGGQINPVYADMKLAADRLSLGELQAASANYWKEQMKTGATPMELYKAARASLMANSPISGTYDSPRYHQYLMTLPVGQRLEAGQVKSKYESIINQVFPPLKDEE